MGAGEHGLIGIAFGKGLYRGDELTHPWQQDFATSRL